MSWRVRWEGFEIDSDDFTVAELGDIETTTGTSWALAIPWASVPVAKAFLAVAMLRAGLSQEQTAEELEKLTWRALKAAFSRIDEADDGGGEPDPLPSSRSSAGSSRGGRGGAGRPRSPEPSAGATSD